MPVKVASRALNCPNCGSTVRLRGFAHTLSAVCESCQSVLDTSNPNLIRIMQAQAAQPVPLKIPLGERCQLEGAWYQVIGFQQRAIFVEGQRYTWQEYLLFQPYKGFRYLTDYEGHWNLVKPLPAIPDESSFTSNARYGGQNYRLFQTANAQTVHVLGEFPWRVTVGETVAVRDYVNAPSSLSKEMTPNEVNWSQGRYVPIEEMKQAFGGRVSFAAPVGVYSNQPNPHAGKPLKMWLLFAAFLLGLIVSTVLVAAFHKNEEVFTYRAVFNPAATGEQSFVTDFFDIKGIGARAVDVDIRAAVNQNWAAFAIALINQDTGEGFDFGKTLSYYSGTDSDGSWTEGSTSATETMRVPPGRYYLRVEPDRELEAGENPLLLQSPISYEIHVKQDVPIIWPFFVAFLLLPIPPIWVSARYGAFESKRWAESDPLGPGHSSDSDSGGDDD